jgi:hypothetical protein
MSTKERRTGRDENNLLREFLDNQKSNNGRPLLMRIKMLSRKQTDIKKVFFCFGQGEQIGRIFVYILGDFLSVGRFFVCWAIFCLLANFRLWGDCLIRAVPFILRGSVRPFPAYLLQVEAGGNLVIISSPYH